MPEIERARRPQVVSIALWLSVVATLIGLTSGITRKAFSTAEDWILGAIGLAIGRGVLIAIAQGRTWARWVWVIISVSGVLTSVDEMRFVFTQNTRFGLIHLMVELLTVVGCALLFRPRFTAWFRRKPFAGS